MLGIEKDPKLVKIRDENPLNRIKIPNCEIDDVEARIQQYYIPVDPQHPTQHPLLITQNLKNF